MSKKKILIIQPIHEAGIKLLTDNSNYEYEILENLEAQDIKSKISDITNNIFKSNLLDERIKSIQVRSKNIFDSSFSIIDAIEKLELVKSRSEIKRLIKSDGIKINDQIYKENNFSLKQYASEKEVKISVGKKKIGKLKITD